MKSVLLFLFKNIWLSIFDPSVRAFLRILVLGAIKQKFKISTIKLIGLEVEFVDPKALAFQYKEIFAENFYNFKTQTNKNDGLILDCGSNIGLSALYFAKRFPHTKIVCVEADPEICKILKRNIKRNNITGVEIINKAIWHEETVVCFLPDGNDGGRVDFCENHSSISIETIRLKDLLNRYDQITMLKLDVEGAELSALQDCCSKLNDVENMFIEYHSRSSCQQELSKLITIIETAGFRYFITNSHSKRNPYERVRDSRTYDLLLNIFCFR